MLKINLNPNQTLWFTSDTHYGHRNLCSGVTRWRKKDKDDNEIIPENVRNFDSLDQMNQSMINNINKCIKQDDILVHLGDWSFGGFENIKKFRDQIVCKNIILITGNHDEHIINNRDGIQSIFTQVIEFYTQLEVQILQNNAKSTKTKFILCHFPIASWEKMAKGMIQLHGHVHLSPNQALNQGKALDVGMDGNNMKPYSMSEILSIMQHQPTKPLILPSDHHDDEWIELKDK